MVCKIQECISSRGVKSYPFYSRSNCPLGLGHPVDTRSTSRFISTYSSDLITLGHSDIKSVVYAEVNRKYLVLNCASPRSFILPTSISCCYGSIDMRHRFYLLLISSVSGRNFRISSSFLMADQDQFLPSPTLIVFRFVPWTPCQWLAVQL
jgi:hypothetical protein